MCFKSRHRRPGVSSIGATAICLAMSAGAAQAVTFNLDLGGRTETFSGGGSSTLSVDTLSASDDVADGATLSFDQIFTIDGFTNGLDETRNIDRTLMVSVDGSSQSQTLSQTARVRGERTSIDGGGSPDNTRFRQFATLSNPGPLSFTFTGVGTFEVDVEGDTASTFFATTAPTATGNLPVNVSFTAKAQPEPEPDPSPVPLPAGLPLLIGALGMLGVLRGRRRTG